MDRGGVVGLQDHPQLGLDSLLGLQQPVPVAGQGFDLGQHGRGQRERPPMTVLVAQRVGQNEGVEAVVLDRGDLIPTRSLHRYPRPCRHQIDGGRYEPPPRRIPVSSSPSRPGMTARCEPRAPCYERP